MNDILEGYYKKRRRENDAILFTAKMIRKAAFVSIAPHTKNLTEKRFNMEVWPLDETEQEPDNIEERVKKVQESVRKYNKQLSENRRKKAIKK